ncbi:MAG: SURF1 family protein [Propioniciclava sp.]
MRRTWVRWLLLTVFVVALAVTFINLGRWQLDRLDQRREQNTVVAAHENAAVISFAEAFDHPIAEEDQWQRVEVHGTYDAEHQVQVRYRSLGDLKGWELLTPLSTTDGRTVIINRGFIERPSNEDFPRSFPAPPSGEITVIGYVRRNDAGPDDALTPTENTVRLINSDALGSWMGTDLANGYVSLISSDPPQTGAEFHVVTPPPPTEGPHLSYALQWFSFTLIAGVGLFILIRNDIRDSRKLRERSARDAAAAAPQEQPDGPDTDPEHPAPTVAEGS